MIRLATEADIPAMLEIYGPYVRETAYSFEYTVPTAEEFTVRFRHHTHFCPWLVWEEEGQVLGYAYGAPAFERAAYRWCGEVSIYLAPRAQGRGVGKRMYAALEKLMAHQGYWVLYAIVTSENISSVAFHQALGYRQRAVFPDCGFKFGRWMGTVWLEKRLENGADPGEKPADWAALVENDRFASNILANLSLS